MTTSLNQIAGTLKTLNDQKKISNMIKQLNEKYKSLEDKYKSLEDKYNNQSIIIEQLKESLSKQGNLLLQYIEKDIKPINMTEQTYLYNKVSDLQRDILYKDYELSKDKEYIRKECEKINKNLEITQSNQSNLLNKENDIKKEIEEEKEKDKENEKVSLISIKNINRRLTIL
jgi:hypothetical protein